MEGEMQNIQSQDGLLGFMGGDAAPAPAAEDPFAEPAAGEYTPPAMPAAEGAPFGGYEQVGGGMDPMAFTAAPPMPAGPPASIDPMSFTAAAPAISSPTGYVDPFQGMPVSDTGMGSGSRTIPEMSALREWEDKHERELEEIDTKEKAETKERRQAAADELGKWYADLSTTQKKRQEANRSDEATTEKARLEAMKPGANPWERVVDLIDTNAHASDESRDTSRMRSLLIHLKTSPVITASA
mmetsp:Transcript_13605/g.38664  ORF Transcript_13605/g.38664 Transcript_13605/m.38664 type:complete len:241 (-) Transcript_13605:265-987(-)